MILHTLADWGNMIKDVRKSQKLTQEDLAGLSGVARRFIVELEKGKPTLQIGKVLKVSQALGIGISGDRKWN